jgi:hypothetical protein
MKVAAIGLALVVVLGVHTNARSQPRTAGPCRVDGPVVSADGTVRSRALPYFLEIELTVTNRLPGRLRLDPMRFVLVPDQGDPVGAAAPDQVVSVLRSPSPAYLDLAGVVWTGSVAIGVGVGPIDLQARAIEARMLKPGDVASGASVRGSIYFGPAAWPAQFTLSLDGLAGESSAALPPAELRGCQMPYRPSQPPVVVSPVPAAPRTFLISARATAGPVAVSVSKVEFARHATTVSVAVENGAAVDADLFVAIGQAELVDGAGRAYAVRMLRSDLADRVAAGGQVRGILVFDPLPMPAGKVSAVLLMPGVRVAGATYDIRIDLQF